MVGVKVVPNGLPDAHSSFEIVLEVIEKLKAAGVKTSDMFVYDRFRGELMAAGYHKVLPGGVRWGGLDPEGSSQFKLQFLIYVPTADLFARMRTAQAAQELEQEFLDGQSDDNGLERHITATRRQNFLVPPRRHRAFPLLELADQEPGRGRV